MQLRQIEIDFDIHQMIELERRGFEEPPYVALRRLLKIAEKMHDKASDQIATARLSIQKTGRKFYEDGVSIPHGSLARMTYGRGTQVYEGQFLDGRLVVNGVAYGALSPAASALGITKKGDTTSLNGWLYWEAKFPGEAKWRKLWDIREAAQLK